MWYKHFFAVKYHVLLYKVYVMLNCKLHKIVFLETHRFRVNTVRDGVTLVFQ